MTALASIDDRPGSGGRLPVPKRPGPAVQTVLVWTVMVALLAASVWSFIDLQINVATMVDGVEHAVDFVGRMFPLDFPPAGELAAMTLQTLAIVVVATALAVALSLPLAIFAASNVTTGRLARSGSRTVIVTMRAIPDLVLAIIFFRIFGIGALPGILALGLHSIGMIGKLYADAIEQIDPGPAEALDAAGASRWQKIVGGVIPQVMPQLIATALHRFDINLRTSVILGYVGVGGIGLEISQALNSMNYQRGMALAFVVLVLCIVTELISGSIRAALLGRAKGRRRGPAGWLDRASAGWIDRPLDGHRVPRTRDGAVRTTPPWDGERIRRTVSVGLAVVIVAAATLGAGVDVGALLSGLADAPHTLGLFWPPSDGGMLDQLLEGMLVTIQIGLAATLIGVVLAVPIGSLAARNVAPSATVALGFRTLIVVVRAFPELIVAIILIVMLGLGPVPGALALGLGSIGLLGKLVADSLEETDVRVQDALRANGATRLQVYAAATVRQVAPAFVAHVLYQLDVNVRAATLLGIVGAGGIGFYLLNASRVMAFDTVTFIVGMILVVVLALEALAAWTRKTVI